MLPTYHEIDQQAENTRKRWLLATLCSFVLSPMFLFIALGSYEKDLVAGNTFLNLLTHAAIGLSIGLLPSWLAWHCAYRRHGTALLMFWLIVGPFRFFVVFAAAIGGLVAKPHKPLVSAALIFEAIAYVWWYILSFKLRKINKKFWRPKKMETI
ncbi:MAG: hypothetical protein HYZ54_09370 [Ignavibacteriae bacterium]|nr:hypothetical protein [Ignavibacteriota bacterium]